VIQADEEAIRSSVEIEESSADREAKCVGEQEVESRGPAGRGGD